MSLDGTDQETAALRRCARDLAALSALPAIWFASDLRRGLQNLADVLATAVRAKFVYIRVHRPDGTVAESISSDLLRASLQDAAAMGRILQRVVQFESIEQPPALELYPGDGLVRLGISQVAADGKIRGVVIAAAGQERFPNEYDRLLLNTGATQIAILLQRSDIETEVARRSHQLDESNQRLRDANRALLSTKRRLDSTLAAAEVGTWIWDLEANLITGDPNLAGLFGMSVEEAEDAPPERYIDRVHPDDRDRVVADISRALETSEYTSEYRVPREQGDVRWLVARGRVERDANGRPTSLPGVVLDITDRRIAEDELRLARDSAESANRAKDHFLAVLSHELRTPLSPILMTVAALEEDFGLPDRMRSAVAMIRRNIELETQLIDDLLDVSRVASGKLRLQLQPTHLHEILGHALETCRSEISGKSLIVEQSFAANSDLVMGDPARLQQVFWNLLRNAAKFTPEGGRIFIRTFGINDERLAVEVRDTGIGIPEDVLPRVFSPFEQGETSVTRKFGGLGLGLAICKAVMEMHGGSVRAFSDGPGSGASFITEFAVLPPPDTPPSPLGTTVASATKPLRNRILLVEDHADTAKSLAWLLTRSGYQVTTAHTAASAIEAVRQQQFDIMASDIGLPDMNGYDLMRQVHREQRLVGIALSGFGMDEDVQRAFDAGFVEHIVKPVNIAQLRATLQRLLTDEGVSVPSGDGARA